MSVTCVLLDVPNSNTQTPSLRSVTCTLFDVLYTQTPSISSVTCILCDVPYTQTASLMSVTCILYYLPYTQTQSLSTTKDEINVPMALSVFRDGKVYRVRVT